MLAQSWDFPLDWYWIEIFGLSPSDYQHQIISIGLKSNAAISLVPMALVVNCRPVGSADFVGMGFNPCLNPCL
jgi:hypothetical protein